MCTYLFWVLFCGYFIFKRNLIQQSNFTFFLFSVPNIIAVRLLILEIKLHQKFIYCKATLHVSGVTAPIIGSIQNCTRSLRYSSYYLYRYSTPTWSDWDWFVRVARNSHKPVILQMMGAVTPETCRVALQ